MSKVATEQTGSRAKSTFWVFVVLASCFLVFLMPTIFILFVVGMVPTWIAGFVERHGMGRVQVTAGLNLAGVIPFIAQLWHTNGSFDALMSLAGNIFVWGAMYGSAGAAVALLWMGPQVAAMYLDFKAARYTSFLERQKAILLEEWGDSLGTDDEEEKFGDPAKASEPPRAAAGIRS